VTRGSTVFVIDDDAAVRDSICVLLESEGFVVHAFASCADFLRQPRPKVTDCLLLDVHMDGMSGLELLNRLDSDNIHLPTIVMTGMPDTRIGRAVDRFGAVLLVKPFKTGELVALVERVLRQNEPC
jgi:FixJ family two-component response regulator